MHRSRKTPSNFDIEIRVIKVKYNKSGYPRQFIESFIRYFITPLDKDESFIIPPNMFAVKKPFLLLEIPYYEENEITSKRFIVRSVYRWQIWYCCKMINKEGQTIFSIKYSKFISVTQNLSRYMQLWRNLHRFKPFVMLENVGQNIILLIINQNQQNILLIT